MSLREFDDDYLVLSSPPPSEISLAFTSFNSSYAPIVSTSTSTSTSISAAATITTNTSSSTINGSKVQRRTSNFFPTSDNTALSTPNIQLSSDSSFHFPNMSNSSTTMLEQVPSSSTSTFATFNKSIYSEPPLSPFYNHQPNSVTGSTTSSPVLNTFSQPTFNRIDYKLSNSLGNLTIHTPVSAPVIGHSQQPQPQQQKQQQPQPQPQHSQTVPHTPQKLGFGGFMISTGNSASSTSTSDFQVPQPALSIWNNNSNRTSIGSNNSDVEISQKVIKRENRYLNKVNNPVFIPSGPISETSIMEDLGIITSERDISYFDSAIEEGENDEQDQEQDQEQQQQFKQPQLREARNEDGHRDNKGQGDNSADNESNDCPRIKFPMRVPYTPKNDCFIQDMINYDFTNRYSEGYSTTFYKRNKHGYMFIRESTNTLHVHQNSWIQLKIKLPVSEKKLLIKKLKVDIKELPIWKPKA